MMQLQTLATIATRIGRPGALVRVGTSGGRLLYLEAAMTPVSVVAALERPDVLALRDALSAWLTETGPTPVPAPAPAGGGEWTATACLCSDYADQHDDGGRCNVLGCPCLVFRPREVLASVQSCTVAQRARPSDLRERAQAYGEALVESGRLMVELGRDG